ncbi:unnamed protein product [Closterium sp. NIES-53]
MIASHNTLLLPALLGAAMLAGALLPGAQLPVCRPACSRTAARTSLPATPYCSPPCWLVPCCPHSPATCRPAVRAALLLLALLRAALLAGALLPTCRLAAHALPCWQPHRCPHRPACAALLLPALLCAALLAAALPCPGCAPVFPSFRYMAPRLTMYLLSESKDSILLFDHTSGASLAPPATADNATRSQWLIRDAAACLAVRNHLSLAKRAHFVHHKTAKAPYDAVVARYSSPATAALDRLILPYLFPKLSPFATIEDPYITLYFIVTHLPDSLRAVRDHFLVLDPTDLTVDLLEKHLLAAETSAVVVGAARGTPRTPFFEGTAAARARVARVVAVAAEVVVVEAVELMEVAEVVAVVEVVAGVRASMAAVVAAVGVGVVVVAAVGVVAAAVVAVEVELFRGEVLAVARGSSSIVGTRPLHLSSFVSGLLSVGRLEVVFAARISFAQCVPPDPGIEAAALGASESALLGIALGASCCFFHDSTTLTPLPAPVPVRVADPSGGPILARSSTVLPCLAVSSSSLSGLHLPSFSTNLVSTAALQDGHYHHSWGSGSSPLLVSPPVAPDSPVAPRPWSPLPATPSWHALPPPCFWSSQVSASPPGLACPALPSLRRGEAARRDSLLLVVDDCTRYTTVFPLRSMGEVPDVLIPWIRAVRLQLRERFREDLLVLRLHSDRGGEFFSDLFREFCRGEGIL